MTLLKRFFQRSDPRDSMVPLYNAIVTEARHPSYYIEGNVPDSREGRFEMVAALLSLTLLRLEQDDAQKQNSVFLTELFVSDMDGQLRQFGIGDMLVGKHIGKLMSALGGRLGAYRAASDNEDSWENVVRRNFFEDDATKTEQAIALSAMLENYRDQIAPLTSKHIIAGQLGGKKN